MMNKMTTVNVKNETLGYEITISFSKYTTERFGEEAEKSFLIDLEDVLKTIGVDHRIGEVA